jgi:Flp pilus assembly protein TadD
MKIYRLGAAIVIACVFIALASQPVSAKEKWINLQTKNFNIVSNADEGDTRELALKLEQFRYIFQKIFNLRTVTTVPVTVVVFKNDGAFKPYKPLYNGKPANLAGYFQRGEDENIIVLNISGNELHPMAVIFHEYTHLLTSQIELALPLWLNEGLAELYSTFEVKKNEVMLGIPISNHVYFLRDQKFLPLESLFAVEHGSPAYNERDKQGVFYAQSWALIHYLTFGNERARQLQLVEFVKLLGSGIDVKRAFNEAFKTDYATMEKELRRYIGNRTYPGISLGLASVEGEKEVRMQPLADSEMEFHLGNLLMRQDRLDEAETRFKQAAALDANLARPYEGLGFVALRRDKFEEAEEFFKQAVAHNSKNHLAHYYYAASLQRKAMGDGDGRIKPELAKPIIEELKTAIKLMPGFAHSYSLLGYIYLLTEENLAEGAEMMKAAMRLEPQNKHHAINLANIQVRMDDFAGARKTLEPLLASDDPGIKGSAVSMMKMIDDYTRPQPQQQTPSDGAATAPTESEQPAGPPQLKRKDGDTVKMNKSGTGPVLKFEGAETMTGTLAAIECGNGMTLVLKTAEGLVRFAVSDPAGLHFYSRDPNFNVTVGCGPINIPAYIHFKPLAGSKKQAGDAVAVEFIKQ